MKQIKMKSGWNLVRGKTGKFGYYNVDTKEYLSEENFKTASDPLNEAEEYIELKNLLKSKVLSEDDKIYAIIDKIEKEKLESKKAIFKKFDKYAVIKNDDWYLGYKKEVL